MDSVIVIFVIAVILGLAGGYIWKVRKKGVKCIGCPESAKCSGSCAGCSGNCCGHPKD